MLRSEGLETIEMSRENVAEDLPHISTTDGTPSLSIRAIVVNVFADSSDYFSVAFLSDKAVKPDFMSETGDMLHVTRNPSKFISK